VAWSYEQAGRLQEAEAEYKRAAALNASDWSNRNELALFYDRHNRYDDAIEQVKQAIVSSTDNPMLYFNLGAFYLDSGNPSYYPLAEDALRKSLSLAPSNGGYGNLALLYLHEKRYQEAAAAAEKAVALDRRQILTWRVAELAYRWLGERQKADAALDQIEKLAQAQAGMNPRDAVGQSWVGLVDAQKGQCERAAPHLEAALSLSPGDSQVVVNAVEAYNHCADETNAKKLIEKARQSGVSLADLRLDPEMQLLLAK
jgi:eukaryotic-like serine/threonine-protein kinase